MKIPCTDCSQTFKFQRSLKSHREKVHNMKSLSPLPTDETKFDFEERPYKCTKCERTFKNSGHLSDHVIVVHDKGSFNCSFNCGFKARSRFRVRKHREAKHPEGPKRGMKSRGKSRSKNYKKSLKRAIQVSNIKVKKDSEENVSVKSSLMRKLMKRCLLCDKDIRARDVNYHMKKRHFTTNPKKIQENIAESGDSEVTTTKSPNKAPEVDEDKNNDPLKCDQCNQTFSCPANTQRHINGVHLKIKIPCDYCGREFTQESNLKTHIDQVHDRKRQECSICPFMAITSSKLQEHMKNEHKATSVEDSDVVSPLSKKIPGPPPGPKIVSVEGSVPLSTEFVQEPSIIPGEKLLTEEDDTMSGIVEFEFILEQEDLYCDLCTFETQDEKKLGNHLVISHFDEVYGR